MRIAVVMNMIAPHATPVFAALSQHAGVDLLVVYEARMEGNRRWRPETDLPFEHVVLHSLPIDLTRVLSDTYLNLPLRPVAPLKSFEAEVVIAAGAGVWASPSNIAAFAARARNRWAIVPWWVSFPRDTPSLPRRIAEPWVHRFMSSSDAWIVYGTRSREEALRLGAAADRVVEVPPVPPLRIPERSALRPASERARGIRFLIVAQLIERKGIGTAIEAFRSLDGPHELWVAGDGPLAETLAAEAAKDRRISMLGHLEWSDLSERYKAADVFVLPSHYEVWGQVISEAQAHGMPTVTTDAVGAAADLVHPEVGAVVPPADSGLLASAMRTITDWPEAFWERCAREARRQALSWTAEDAARGFELAAELGLAHRQ